MSLTGTDLDASTHFYRYVLGLRQIERPPFDFPGAWFELGDRQLHLIVNTDPTFRDGKGVDSRDVHFSWVGRVQRLGEPTAAPEAHQRQRVLQRLAPRADGIGPSALQPAGKLLEALLGESRVGNRPGAADLHEDRTPVALRQQVTEDALVVTVTPMQERVLAEHVLDRAPEGLDPDLERQLADLERDLRNAARSCRLDAGALRRTAPDSS